VVLCSGLSGLYPRGVVVGRVKKVDASPDGQELQVEVSPSVDFSRLEDVQIVLGPGAPGEPLATPEILLPPALLPGGTDTATPAEARPVGPPATPKAAPGPNALSGAIAPGGGFPTPITGQDAPAIPAPKRSEGPVRSSSTTTTGGGTPR